MPFAQTLLYQIGLPAGFPSIEDLDVNKHRVVFPLASRGVLLLVAHGITESSNFSAVREDSNFWVTGQTTDQDNLVDVSHVGSLLCREELFGCYVPNPQ